MESKNLFIRETVFKDCEYFAKWEKDVVVNEYFSIDEDRSFEDIATEFVKDNEDKTKAQFTITRMADKEPIGRIVITEIDKDYDSLDITRIYLANKKDRKQGLGEEALRLILEYAFIVLHMERVTIDHFLENKAAAAFCQKVGFKNEGVMRHAGKKNGKYYDLQLLSILRSDYYSNVYE